MSKSYIFGVVFGIVLLTVGVFAGSKGPNKLPTKLQQAAASKLQQVDEEELFEAEIGDATPVQPGILTTNQRVHSNLFTYYQETSFGNTISKLVADSKGKRKIVQTVLMVPLLPVPQPDTPENFFGKLANNSQAIVRGVVTGKTSQITQDDSFIFTDYQVAISEVVKNNATTPIKTGATIIVTRPGGKVLVDGIIVKATDKSHTPFSLGKEVLLFLKYIPESATYQVTDPMGSFELEGSSFRPLTGIRFPPGVLNSKDSLLETLQAVTKR